LVGPDNGLLTLAAQHGGGVIEAAEIGGSKFRLEPVSATFHGRDIFAPVAARLAAGVRLAEAGRPCDPASLISLKLPESQPEGDVLVTHALYIDRFGNVQLGLGHDELAQWGLTAGHRAELQTGAGEIREAWFARTFADVAHGALLLYEDSNWQLAVAVRHGSAAARLGVSIDDEIRIRVE
jgi:S-adenosylmethionine hydrolase